MRRTGEETRELRHCRILQRAAPFSWFVGWNGPRIADRLPVRLAEAHPTASRIAPSYENRGEGVVEEEVGEEEKQGGKDEEGDDEAPSLSSPPPPYQIEKGRRNRQQQG